MKITTIINLVVVVIFCSTGMALSDNNWKDKSGNKGRDKQQYEHRNKEGQSDTEYTGSKYEKKGSEKQRQGKREKKQDDRGKGDGKKVRDDRGRSDFGKQQDARSHKGSNKGHDYGTYHGYNKRPYQRNRHYEHHDHGGHRYAYQGHWKSWDQWDKYAKAHPDIRRHGDYYREDAHLMFRFRDPLTGAYFFFSIGR